MKMSFYQTIEPALPMAWLNPIYSLGRFLNNHILGRNRTRTRGHSNRIERSASILKRTSITIYGDGNTVVVGDRARLLGATIIIRGNGCRLTIGPSCKINARIELFGDGCHVAIGERTTITESFIGRDCMIGRGSDLRTGDSHVIINAQGQRLNPAQNISLSDHVWLGQGAFILKGTRIGTHTIIGAQAVAKGDIPAHCIVAGVPGRIIRHDISWVRDLSAWEARDDDGRRVLAKKTFANDF